MANEHLLTVSPTTEANWHNENVRTEGLLLRDYFAAKAMHGIIRRYDGHSFGGGPNSPHYKELAEDAYLIADAMIKARG